MNLVRLNLFLSALVALTSCTKPNPAFCHGHYECTDPAAPYCDLDGTVGGKANACVAARDPDAGASSDAAAPTKQLTVVLEGDGGGSIVSSPAGIDCPGACTASFAEGAQVMLVAAPSDTSLFAGWSGDCSGESTSCLVTLDLDRDATVTFNRIRVIQIAGGGGHTCALLESGAVRCWGMNDVGQLGYGHTDSVGDDELPYEAGDVDLRGAAVRIAAGTKHTCAVMTDGAVRCWGWNDYGQLGYANTNYIGDDELPSDVVPANLGGAAIDVACGALHTCARLDSGAVRCWGYGVFGRLGYGNSDDIGDDESPALAGDVDVGGSTAQLALGNDHTCARLSSGSLRCWGRGTFGRLGYLPLLIVGDDETPASVGDVDVGGSLLQIGVGIDQSCALLEGGGVRCWGRNHVGQLGMGHTDDIGDDELPSSVDQLTLGATAADLVVGAAHACIKTTGGWIRCWGRNQFGQLGQGHTNNVGDDELPDTQLALGFDVPVVQLAAGAWHTCVLVDGGDVRCWGNGASGALGYGSTENIGDDELGSTATVVPVLAPEAED